MGMVEEIRRLIAETVRDAVREAVRELRGEKPVVTTEPPTPPLAPGPEYVSAKEAARIMSAHPSTVRKLIAHGKLGRYSVEGKLRVRVAELHAYLARESQPGPPVDLDRRALEILGHGSPRCER
jgi:excisionase family DNA binding protein